jgi:hypothetical protein
MEDKNIQALKEIQEMMAKSSRFISLSGLSGIAAGVCAMIGAFFANQAIAPYYKGYQEGVSVPGELRDRLIIIGLLVFIAALITSFLFTLRKSKKDNIPIWGQTSLRLLWNTFLPMGIGAALILKLIMQNNYDLVAPACLLFYGLGLINGSKYTLSEIKYLGYAQLILGLLNLWLPLQGLYFWAIGFGILHIVYGFIMWNKYERGDSKE